MFDGTSEGSILNGTSEDNYRRLLDVLTSGRIAFHTHLRFGSDVACILDSTTWKKSSRLVYIRVVYYILAATNIAYLDCRCLCEHQDSTVV